MTPKEVLAIGLVMILVPMGLLGLWAWEAGSLREFFMSIASVFLVLLMVAGMVMVAAAVIQLILIGP